MSSTLASPFLRRLGALKLRCCVFALCASGQAFAQTQPVPADATGKSKSDTGSVPGAFTPTPDQCVHSHRESQTLRRQYHLLESRDRLLECSNTTCPAPVRNECQRWLDEVGVQISSVVVHVDTGDTSPPSNIKVFINGVLRFESIPDRAIELDPGTYRFRFEVEGRQPVELLVTVVEAEKFKNVTVKYSPPEHGSTSVPVGQDTPGQKPISISLVAPSKKPATRPVPTITYVFAGVGTAAAINFAVWGLWTQSLKSQMEDKCAPDCDRKYIDRAKTRALIADTSLAVSFASFTLAAITYFARPEVSPPMDVSLGPLPEGGLVGRLRLEAF